MLKKITACLLATFLVNTSWSQTTIDSTFSYQIETPAFTVGKGPIIGVDAGHNNRHTKKTGLSTLCKVLEQDGFQVIELDEVIQKETLEKIDVLVIVNALNSVNNKNWKLPTPSAFSSEEISKIKEWILSGGKLFLSADHMPYAGAAQDLATALGVDWGNNFDKSKKNRWPPADFSLANKSLVSCRLTDGTDPNMLQVTQIGTFTGSAFKAKHLNPLLVFDSSYELLFPEIAWDFNRKTKKISAENWLQGAYGSFGKGRIVLLGESAMFTAQLRNRTKIGMNSDLASQNIHLAINIFRYLASN